MKKLFLFVMIILPAMLGGGCLSAQTVSNLQVIPGAAGTASTVTFDVEWVKADLNLKTPWLDSMWVFVDYNENGAMTRLELSGGTLTTHSATTPSPQSPDAGTVIKIAGNDRGVWVVGDARTSAAGSFSARVQLFTKKTDITIAGACAYASSYPPVSNWLSEVKLGLTGTPMYEITLTPSGGGATITVEAGDSFLLPCSYTMSSFTDKTGAPGIINCMPPTALTLATPFTTVCAGETITLTASATGAASYSINGTDWYASNVFEVPSASNASYTLYAKTAAGCVASVADAAVVTVNPLPTITHVTTGGDASQNVNQYTAITDIVYTATDATGISSSSSFPDGVGGIYSSGSYTISGTPTVAGIFNYTVTTANGNGCTDATSSGTIIVMAVQRQGNCTYTEPAVVGTFASFPGTYSASTYVSLVDERDVKIYPVVKIADRWIMARNLNYQEGLTWEADANDPSKVLGSDTDLIGHFWCPGFLGSSLSIRESCEVWGALYSWETAMMPDGYGTWTEIAIYSNGAASATNAMYNHGRTAHSGTGTGGRGICPPNWHVPTDNEWGIILDGMESGGGTAHQNAATSGWYGTNASARGKSKCMMCSSGNCATDEDVNWSYSSIEDIQGTDDYGFRVLPAGGRAGFGIEFSARGNMGIFWSSSLYHSTAAVARRFDFNYTEVHRSSLFRSYGYPIRCIKDN